MRQAGILMPLFSLPSRSGIGTLGKEAYRFVDFLHQAKQTIWQLLPLNKADRFHSPYASDASFSIDECYIDLEDLVAQKLLKKEDIIHFDSLRTIQYPSLEAYKMSMLKKAFQAFDNKDLNYQTFLKENRSWIYEYALYKALKDFFEHKPFYEWPLEIKTRQKKALKAYKHLLAKTCAFYRFIQYEAHTQYQRLKKYANSKHISLMGDMPIYVSYDSFDVWKYGKAFLLEEDLSMVASAGVPPDYFSEEGQNWKNPLYRWNQDTYVFWDMRFKEASKLYDKVRIDHFIGLSRYYVIPKDKSAKEGYFETGPGYSFIHRIQRKFKDLEIVAEDLGVITQDVISLLEKTKIPGMNVLQFAFNPYDNSKYLPHNHLINSITYTGTHDNETTSSWLESLNKEELAYLKKYLNKKTIKTEDLIIEAMKSVSRITIIPIQDYLNLGKEGRINHPGTTKNNWMFRVLPKEMNTKLQNHIKDLTMRYHR